MMLIRVNGGKAGIKEYLEEGIKNGRDHTRDELDRRFILDGDLSVTNQVIKQFNSKGDKYLHITLSFKEDHIPEQILKDITSEFKNFALKAYDDDEYNFYAEAHLPKIKSYIDKSTGETVDRKPHIHIVIPRVNLKTEKRLEPFGLEKSNLKYIDAFQETINEKYRLASPKIEIRNTFVDNSTLISRQKGDIFKSNHREIKSNVLELILENNISNNKDFTSILKEHGYSVTIRNKGKDNEYLNIKENGQKKGINLKESVFQTSFLSLSKEEKTNTLAPKHNTYLENINNYKASEKSHSDLKHWNDIRSYELKYVNRRNRKEYKALSDNEKQAFLANKRKEHERTRFSESSIDDIKYNLGTAECYLSNAKRNSRCIESGVRVLTQRRLIRAARTNLYGHSRNQGISNWRPERQRIISSCLEQHQNSSTKNIIDINHIKKNMTANDLLNALSLSHGLNREKYKISLAHDGTHRIRCGSRNLNISDFLTKEMGFNWLDAKDYLEKSYTNRDVGNVIKSETPKNMISAAWQAQIKKEKSQKLEYIEKYRIEKKAIFSDSSLSKTERNIALSIVQMNKVINDIHYKRTTKHERELISTLSLSITKGTIMNTNQSQVIRTESGTLLEHGSAPYQNNKDNNMSYYVKLDTQTETKVIWGKGLKEAVSKLDIGDNVKLDLYDKKNVVVPTKEKQKDGSVIFKDVDALRNEWVGEKIPNPSHEFEKPTKENQLKGTGKNQEKEITIGTKKHLDLNLEASRLLVHYPRLKELGVTPQSINKTDKGDKINYNGKDLSVTELMKETHNLKPKEILEQLNPIYEMQEADKKRVIDYKNEFMTERRVSIADMDKEYSKNKEEKTLAPIYNLSQQKDVENQQNIKPIQFNETISHKINDKGHISYYQDSTKLVTDRGKDVLIENQSDKAVEIGLRLAVEKYGSILDVKGSDEYKKQLVQVAAKNNLSIEFTDKKMNAELIQVKKHLSVGENVISKAEQTQHKSHEKQLSNEQNKSQGFSR